jgi:hypothetical protein
MRKSILQGLGGILLLVAFCAPFAQASDSTKTAYPGTLNYVEGQVAIGSQNVGANQIGTARLEPQQTLRTENGKAEVLLTPGVFLRVGDQSAVQMISPSLTDTEVAIDRGEATIEVDDVYPQNRLIVDEGSSKTRLVKNGFYDFDADNGVIRVFSGKAELSEADRNISIKGGHEVTLGVPDVKSRGFNKTANEDDLYQWSSLRSSYVAQANADIAPDYYDGYGGYGLGWYGTGWYWDPWFDGFTFIPGDGLFYSPFGWGYYSPFFFGGFGFYGGGYGYHYFHHFDSHGAVAAGHARAWGGPRGEFAGGFHGGGGFGGGGFHGGGFGGGGGFHGGGGGGGGHR